MAAPAPQVTHVTGLDITAKSYAPMKRPANSAGRAGKRIVVETNFFPIVSRQLNEIHQLSVEIQAMRDTDPSPRNVRGKNGGNSGDGKSSQRRLIDIAPTAFMEFNRSVMDAFCKKKIPQIKLGYDGRKMAYSAVELPPGVLDHPWPILADRDGATTSGDQNTKGNEEVFVQIKLANVISVRSLIDGMKRDATTGEMVPVGVIEAGAGLSAIDSVLACSPLRNHVQVGRSFFHHTGEHSLGGGALAWRGFYQSARLSQKGLLLNMDESRTPFWDKGGKPLEKLIAEVNRGQPVRAGNDRANKEVAKMLYGLKVRAGHTKITYRVHGFSKDPASRHSFFDEKAGKNVTVEQYLHTTYNIRLNDRQGLCVITNPKKGTMIPIEILTIVPRQRLSKSMTPDQTSNMIRCAATKPAVRKQGAIDAVARVNHNSDETCKAFGISIDPKMMQVPARVLPAPMIQYDDRKLIEPRFGAWNNRHNMKLAKAAPFINWAVLNLSRSRDAEIQGFITQLVKYSKNMGFDPYPQPPIFHGREDQADKEINNIVNIFRDKKRWVNGKWPLQLILVIKFKQDTPTYNMIKKTADLEHGVASQCMLSKHMRKDRGMDMYCGNLLLKINAKLGGQNSIAVAPKPALRPAPEPAFTRAPYIILGADVTHPSGGGNRPSVAALVGSKDREAIQFTGSLRNMPPRQELMTSMGEQFAEVYTRWEQAPEHRGHCAQAIIMFRDGVSEGQFEQVMEHELEAIRIKCHQRDPAWNPRITYIIVTKRHHARFFPRRQDEERSGNIPPGTVIDTDIVSKQYYDFYMNTHSGIQGTSRPSKYTVLWDENNIPIDVLQGYIFKLAHNYVRCNRSVSIVNAAYYAHLLAFRGRGYLGDDVSDSGSIASGSDISYQAYQPLHPTLGKRLFFV